MVVRAVIHQMLPPLPPGSYLALSHLAADRLTGETKDALSDVAERMVRQQITTNILPAGFDSNGLQLNSA
jgi:hypothetical protein